MATHATLLTDAPVPRVTLIEYVAPEDTYFLVYDDCTAIEVSPETAHHYVRSGYLMIEGS